eukprot:6129206-Prymnesium_polylepis.2
MPAGGSYVLALFGIGPDDARDGRVPPRASPVIKKEAGEERIEELPDESTSIAPAGIYPRRGAPPLAGGPSTM